MNTRQVVEETDIYVLYEVYNEDGELIGTDQETKIVELEPDPVIEQLKVDIEKEVNPKIKDDTVTNRLALLEAIVAKLTSTL